jgi:flagellar hook-associated protein 2
MSTTSVSNSLFAGNSRYAQDFQSVIDRSVAIASLPISQLNNDKNHLTNQANALKSLDTQFGALQTAVENLETAMGGASYQTGVSDSAVVGATAGAGVLEGTYSIEVRDIGAYATSMSKTAWDSNGSAATYHLTIGSDSYEITADDNQAANVAAAINAKAGNKVRATVVNVGPASAPDYRVTLQSTRLGDLTPTLSRDSVDLQQAQTTGRTASYVVNNSGVVVASDTRSVQIATGLTVNLLSSHSGSPVDITVTRSSSAVSDALSAFATAYNATLDAVDAQRGTADGALSGQSIVFSLSESLRSLATYAESGAGVNGLSDLGLTLASDGKLSFDPFAFTAADITNSTGITSFLGSSGTGGFIDFATSVLSSVNDSTTGTLHEASGLLDAQTTSITDRIADEQARVDNLKERLQAQMAASDALIASMEQQYNFLYNMFQAQQTAAQQYK